MVATLNRHGIDLDEANAFIDDHGIGRAWIWVRTCKICKGEPGMMEHCPGPEKKEDMP